MVRQAGQRSRRGQGRPPGKVLSALGRQEQRTAAGNREERTIEGHHVHHARIGCPELGSSGMMKSVLGLCPLCLILTNPVETHPTVGPFSSQDSPTLRPADIFPTG